MLDSFITYLQAEKRYSEYTVRWYRNDITDFIESLPIPPEEFDPANVTADDIREWIMKLSERGKLSAVSINRRISAVNSFFRWMQYKGTISANPCLKINTLKTPRRLPVWIPESKMESIADGLIGAFEEGGVRERRDATILLLFYSCGIRLAELISLDVSDISADYGSIRVQGKGDKQRLVPLPAITAGILKRYIDEITSLNIWKSDRKPLFLTDGDKSVSRAAVYAIVRDWLGRMGVQGKRSPHVLRHTFATHLLDNGADMREIQELLGHSSLAATQVYTHSSIAALKKVYQTAHPRSQEGQERGGNKGGKGYGEQ